MMATAAVDVLKKRLILSAVVAGAFPLALTIPPLASACNVDRLLGPRSPGYGRKKEADQSAKNQTLEGAEARALQKYQLEKAWSWEESQTGPEKIEAAD